MEESLPSFHFVTDAFPDRIAQWDLYARLGWKQSVAALDTLLDVIQNAIGVSLPDYSIKLDRVPADQDSSELLALEALAEIGRPLAIQYRGTDLVLEENGESGLSRHIALVYPVHQYPIKGQALDVLALVTLDSEASNPGWSLNNTFILFPVDTEGVRSMRQFQQSTTDSVVFRNDPDPARLPAMAMPFLPEVFVHEASLASEVAVRMLGIRSLSRGIGALQHALQSFRSLQFRIYRSVTPGEENQARMAAGLPALLAENLVVRDVMAAKRSVSC